MVLAEKRSKRLRSTNAVKKVGILNKSLNFIEKIGNKLPDPVTLFVLLSILTIIASFILGNAGVSAEYETVKDGVSEVVKVDAVNLLTKSSMAEFLKNIVSNFTSFAPPGTKNPSERITTIPSINGDLTIIESVSGFLSIPPGRSPIIIIRT